MAAPGVGIGDIINACNYIYKKCTQYKDAVREFDEIASKAKSTTVVLKRLDDEALIGGSLVERAGPDAYEQLKGNLKSLREDAGKLKELMKKYEKIHDIIGRRLLFAFRESDNLTDLRRRIGLHERTIELWYNCLVYGSLRRLENGQDRIGDVLDDILKALNGIEMDKQTAAKVVAEVKRGNCEPLQAELRKRGVSKADAQEYSDLSATYLMASQPERTRIAERLSTDSRRRSTGPPTYTSAYTSAREDFSRPLNGNERPWWRDDDSPPYPDPRANAPPRDPNNPRYTDLHDSLHNIFASPQTTRFNTIQPHQAALNPFLSLSELNPRGRRASYSGEQRPPESGTRETGDSGRSSSKTRRHHRSTSRSSREPGSHSRQSSTHSYHRHRHSLDGARDALEDAEVRRIRMVQRMDRIDSMDPPEEQSGRR